MWYFSLISTKLPSKYFNHFYSHMYLLEITRAYGFMTIYLPSNLADYLRKFKDCIRPWFFKSNETQETVGSFLFLNKNGTDLGNIGPRFKKIMQRYFNSNASVSSIRKAMETAVASCTSLQSGEKNNISLAMLHDPATAQRYYVMKDNLEVSQQTNNQWELFRSSFLPATAAPNLMLSNVNSEQANPVVDTRAAVEQLQVTQTLELIPTSQLQFGPPVCHDVPSLVSEVSSTCTSPERDSMLTRSLATAVASQFALPSKIFPSKSTPTRSPTFVRRVGDWYCGECGYDNFAYRPTCKHCGFGKGKRKAVESLESSPMKKAKHDIVAVLASGKNKDNEKIYKVISSSKGEMWVREKHIPTELL